MAYMGRKLKVRPKAAGKEARANEAEQDLVLGHASKEEQPVPSTIPAVRGRERGSWALQAVGAPEKKQIKEPKKEKGGKQKAGRGLSRFFEKRREEKKAREEMAGQEIPMPEAPAGESRKKDKGKRRFLPFRREKAPEVPPLDSGATTVPDLLSPASADFSARDYVVVDGVYHAYLYIAGYGYTTVVGNGWLNPLVEAGEDVNLNFFIRRQPKEKILSSIAKTTMINRSRMRDVGDTRQDYEELDSAINSGLYLKDEINRSGEDFYYMHTLIEVVADDADTLEQRVSATETLCTSLDLVSRRCD